MTEKFLNEKMDIMISISNNFEDDTNCFRMKDKIYFPVTAEDGEEALIMISPTIIKDVDRRKAEWNFHDTKIGGKYYCSHCTRIVEKPENFCPNCGSEMKLRKED